MRSQLYTVESGKILAGASAQLPGATGGVSFEELFKS